MSQAIDSWRGPASRYNVRFETNVRTVITPISPQTRNLRRLVALRTIEVVGQIGVTAVAAYGLALALPTAFLFALSAGLVLVNMLVWWRLNQPWPVTDAELMANLILDIGVLTALLYFAGGSTNPFVTLYLLPLSIAAAILPTRYTWTLVAITLACYSLLLFVYVPLPHETNSLVWLLTWLPASSGGEHAMHGGQADFGLHVLGMWFNFAVSASLIAWFVVRMAQSLRDRDRQLAHAREAALRNEQLIALGMLAAGATTSPTARSRVSAPTRSRSSTTRCSAFPSLPAHPLRTSDSASNPPSTPSTPRSNHSCSSRSENRARVRPRPRTSPARAPPSRRFLGRRTARSRPSRSWWRAWSRCLQC